MKFLLPIGLYVLFLISCNPKRMETTIQGNYLNNRLPLRPNPYMELPIGAIKPEGWLKWQLEDMAKGMTGHLEELYTPVVGSRNGWLGGDGDGWERGPYWIDGLLPLAYQLEREDLIGKVNLWVEWSLNNQRDDGYFGPLPFEKEPDYEPGLQKVPREDWWPKMVMLKVLKQHYSATGDERVIELMTKYFKFQLSELKKTPLDHWTFWANRRGADNLMIVYWLYNKTGDQFLLELGRLIHEQTFPYTDIFLNEVTGKPTGVDHLYPYNTKNKYPFDQDLIGKLSVEQWQSFHCVNFAQGIKAPIIYYQQDPKDQYLNAVKKAFSDVRKYHGQPQGMYGADEAMHGNDPTKGIEFCSIVEMMFSLENMIQVTGDVDFMDHLEKIAYNALPTQAMDDYSGRQYFQSANQVLISRARHNYFEDDNHDGTDLCFGILTGYPCCTCNMHQGWPKYVQNLWYATPDGGLAALMYGPSSVTVLVGDRQEVTIYEETNFPFEESVRFRITTDKDISFPLHLRIPGWCREATVRINGADHDTYKGGQVIALDREWKNGDQLELLLPMDLSTSRWVENSVAVERGPLVYALKMEENWNWVENDDKFGNYWEVYPKSPWNYGLLDADLKDMEKRYKVVKHDFSGNPWHRNQGRNKAPVEIRVNAKLIPEWTLYGAVAGPLPHGPSRHLINEPTEQITLVPYGCTTLRITEFPVVY